MPSNSKGRALEVADSYLDDIRHTDERDWREKLADLLLAFARGERLEEVKLAPHQAFCPAHDDGPCGCWKDQRVAQLESSQPAKGREG